MQSKGHSLIPWATGRKVWVETFLRKIEIGLKIKRKKKSSLIIVLVTAASRAPSLSPVFSNNFLIILIISNNNLVRIFLFSKRKVRKETPKNFELINNPPHPWILMPCAKEWVFCYEKGNSRHTARLNHDHPYRVGTCDWNFLSLPHFASHPAHFPG